MPQSEFQPYRTVAAADAAPAAGLAPTLPNHAIDTLGWDTIRVALQYSTSGGAPAVTVTPFWWDAGAARWHADADQNAVLSATGGAVKDIAVKGRYCILSVSALTGTDPSVVLRYALAKERQSGALNF